MESGELSPELKGAGGGDGERGPSKGEVGDEASEGIIRRRLSVTNPFGDDDNDWEADADKDPDRSA